jgi:hypothetical protein
MFGKRELALLMLPERNLLRYLGVAQTELSHLAGMDFIRTYEACLAKQGHTNLQWVIRPGRVLLSFSVETELQY